MPLVVKFMDYTTEITKSIKIFFIVMSQNHHSSSHGIIGAFINEDDASSYPILSIRIHEERFGTSNLDPGDVIHFNFFVILITVKGVYIHFISDLLNDTPCFLSCMADGIFTS